DQGSNVSWLRRVDGPTLVGIPDQLRHHRTAFVIHGGWETICRSAVGLGYRLARNGGTVEHFVSGRISGGSGGRSNLGICREVISGVYLPARNTGNGSSAGPRMRTPRRPPISWSGHCSVG